MKLMKKVIVSGVIFLKIFSLGQMHAMEEEPTWKGTITKNHQEQVILDAYYFTRMLHLYSGTSHYPFEALTAMFKAGEVTPSPSMLEKIKVVATENPTQKEVKKECEIFLEAYRTIREKNLQASDIKIVEAILAVLKDPYTQAWTIEDYCKEHQVSDGKILSMGMGFDRIDNKFGKYRYFVRDVFLNGPADLAGILKGDQIKKIGDSPVQSFEDVVKIENALVLGQNLPITIERNKCEKTLNLHIDSFQVGLINSHFFPSSKLGYMEIKQFAKNTGEEFDRHFEKLNHKDMKALILDLRDNPGGWENGLEYIFKKFFKSGAYLNTVSRSKGAVSLTVKQGEDFKKPIVILVNDRTASSSELIVSTLKYTNNAKVLGVPTRGKAVGQTVFVGNKIALKITVDKAEGLGGLDYDKIGIAPDYYQPYMPASLMHALRVQGLKELKVEMQNGLLVLDDYITSESIPSFQQTGELYIPTLFAGALAGGAFVSFDETEKIYRFQQPNKSYFELPYLADEKIPAEYRGTDYTSLKEIQKIYPKMTWQVEPTENFTIYFKE